MHPAPSGCFRNLLLGACAALGLFLGPRRVAAEAKPLQPKLHGFALNQVQPGGEIGRRIQLTIRDNFLKLNIEDDFLRPFRHRRPKAELKGFDTFIGGGTLTLAAIAFAKQAGDPGLIARKDYLIGELLRTQSPSGYIGVFQEMPDGAQLWTEYCLHESAYLICALEEDYRWFHQDRSLAAARKFSDYILAHWSQRPPGNLYTTLGLEEAMEEMVESTGDVRYLHFISREPLGRRFAIRPAPLSTWEQPLLLSRPLSQKEIDEQVTRAPSKHEGLHIYRMLSRMLAQVRLAQLEPGDHLLLMSHRLIDALTDPSQPALLVTGAIASNGEVWSGGQVGTGKIVETCTVAYEIWLLDELLRLEGNLRYGDLMERVIYNSLFAAQSPSGRQICYFTPFSAQRIPFDHDTFCCPNSLRRAIADLPSYLYYQSDDGLAINLYSASTAELQLPGGEPIRVRQLTDYPDSGDVKIVLSGFKPRNFCLQVRIPRWCPSPEIRVNGTPVTSAAEGGTDRAIQRGWRPGDMVELHFPMAFRWVRGTQQQEGRMALLYGPLLYGLNPARNPAIAHLNLRTITLDPHSVTGPRRDDSARPGGTSFQVKGWSTPAAFQGGPDLALTLTEFTDFGDQEVFFKSSDLTAAGPDELLGRP